MFFDVGFHWWTRMLFGLQSLQGFYTSPGPLFHSSRPRRSLTVFIILHRIRPLSKSGYLDLTCIKRPKMSHDRGLIP
jgi:hypothetical protein